jgi:steroid delta-isomerase-like uncharacterized protein
MASKDNISLVQKLFDCYKSNDTNKLNAFDELIATNVQFHDPAMQNTASGLQALKQAETNYIKAFPNKQTKVDAIFGIEDRVVVRWSCKGKHTGSFQGIAPTNKEFTISGISIYRIANNKITEVWQNWDHLGLLEQLGVVRQPAMRS